MMSAGPWSSWMLQRTMHSLCCFTSSGHQHSLVHSLSSFFKPRCRAFENIYLTLIFLPFSSAFIRSLWLHDSKLNINANLISRSMIIHSIPFANIIWGFSGSSDGKEFACNAGDTGSIPGLGRSPGEGIGYPLQYSGLENYMYCVIYGGRKDLDMTQRPSLLILTSEGKGKLVQYIW